MRTLSYAKCHRCGNANDRGSQRTCKSCHRIIQTEYRERKRAALLKLEEENAAMRAQLVSFRASHEVARGTISESERAA